MKIRKTDENNDWTFGKGLSGYARDEAAIEQNIQSRVLSWVNDCFFDVQAGVDWKARLDTGQQKALAEEVRAVILQSFGVVGVDSVEAAFDGETRALRVKYNVATIFTPSFEGQIAQVSGVS